MSLYLPYTVTALARTTEPDGKNIVAGALIRVYANDVQQLIYDDAEGANGTLEKQSDVNGLRTIFLPTGEYELDVNGRRTGFAVGVSSPVRSVDSVAALRTTRGAYNGQTVQLVSYYAGSNKGGGVLVWNSTSTAADDGGVTFAVTGVATGRWVRRFDGALSADAFGVVMDGATVNSAATAAIIEACTNHDIFVEFGKGTCLTGQLIVTSKKLKIRGLGQGATTIKMIPGQAQNLISLTGTGVLIAENITLDQNRANQTAGHGIRSGGCDRLQLTSVTIKNSFNYGIGFQGGTSKNVWLTNITIDGAGQDAIDIKDFNFNNECIQINGITCLNYGLDGGNKVAIDVRGEAVVNNVKLLVSGNARGIRFRLGTEQGRAGFGSFNNVTVVGVGTTDATSAAIEIPTDSANFTISNVTASNVGLLILQDPFGRGGQLNNIIGRDIHGTDCVSWQGADTIVHGLQIKNIAPSARCMDFEPTAANIQISNFGFDETTASAEAVRVQAGCTNIALANGWLRGGNVANAGTGTTQTNVRLV